MKENKTQEILNYLKEGNSLSTMQGIQLFNTTGLARYILELRNQGYAIKTDLKVNAETGKTYGVYTLINEDIKQISNLVQDAKKDNLQGKTADAEKKTADAIRLIRNYVSVTRI